MDNQPLFFTLFFDTHIYHETKHEAYGRKRTMRLYFMEVIKWAKLRKTCETVSL